MSTTLILVVLSACSLSKNALAPGGGRDGGGDSALPDAPLTDSGILDSTPSDAPGDAPPSDGGVDADAGPRVPTSIVTVMDTASLSAHPAVLWDGAEFVVGVVTGGHVEILRMPPGTITTDRERVTAVASSSLQDVVLATGGGRLAVGWTEERSSAVAMVRVLPDDGAAREAASDLLREDDRRDAVLYATGGGFGAIFRRESFPGTQELRHVTIGSGSSTNLTSNAGSVGELDIHESSVGTLFVNGNPQDLWVRAGGRWNIGGVLALGAGSEGAVAPFADATVATVWLHANPLDPSERILTFARFLPGTPWLLDGLPNRLSVNGSDPALSPFDGGVLMAFAYPDATDRTLGLVAIDTDGNFIGGPCRVPPMLPTTNDPDVACGGGWCAVVWMEASAYDASDYVTRIIQVPDDRGAFCPGG